MTTMMPGQFLCWLEDEDREEGVVFDGYYYPNLVAEGAAECFESYGAEISDNEIVMVENSAGVVKQFNVTCEMEPVYTATEIIEDEL